MCRPQHAHADAVLRALVGAPRARGAAAKSVARLVGAPAALATHDPAWATEYVLDSTSQDPARHGHVLGVDFGGERGPSSQFRDATDAVERLHEALAQVQDVASELVLLRKCADVCKVVHLLRASGLWLDESAVLRYDALLERSLTRCLGGQLDEASLAQASLGVKSGGLGMRRASDLALPAFVSSRTEARWVLCMLAQQLPGFVAADLVAAFDAGTGAALQLLEEQLTPAGACQVRDLVQHAAAARTTPEAVLGLASQRRHESAMGHVGAARRGQGCRVGVRGPPGVHMHGCGRRVGSAAP